MLLKVDNIHVYYGAIHAIKGISFEVEGVRIISRTEKEAVDVFGLGDGDIAYDYLPTDTAGTATPAPVAPEAEAEREPKDDAPTVDELDWLY